MNERHESAGCAGCAGDDSDHTRVYLDSNKISGGLGIEPAHPAHPAGPGVAVPVVDRDDRSDKTHAKRTSSHMGRFGGEPWSARGLAQSKAPEAICGPTDEFGNPLVHVPKKRRKAKPDVPYERQEQAEVLKAIRRRGLDYETGLEGVHKDKWQRRAAKHAGMKRGNPDIRINTPVPGNPCRGVRIEMKRRKPLGKAPTPEQLERHEKLRQLGELVFVCYGADEARAVLEQLWGPEPTVAYAECADCGASGTKKTIRYCGTCARRSCASCKRDGVCRRCV